ncbi:MAG: hypothetical protein DI534_11955 [Leifsonia xyli]|nr:MAG: hypothetical protein DI534_11955 [Leifsonia xyli]
MMQSQHLLGRITTETTRKTGQEDLDDDNAQNLGRGESRYGKSVRGHDGKPLVAFEPVLDLSTFLRLGERFTRNAGRGVQVRRKAARLGSGLVYCGLCGSKAYVVSSRGRAQYRCSAPSRGESNKCGGMSAAASIVEDGLRSEYLGMLGHLPAVLRVETLSSPEVDTALATVSEQLRTEAAELIRPGADVAAGAARVAELQAERDRLIALPRERRIEEHDLGGTWADVWERSDLVSQRRYLGEAFEYFTMHPAGEPRRIVGVIAESEEEDHGGESTPRDPSALRRRPRSERKATA